MNLNPIEATVLPNSGLCLGVTGEWERGTAMMAKAMALNLAHVHWYHRVFFWDQPSKGEFAEALIRAEAYPEAFLWTPAHKTMGYVQLGDDAGARQAIDQLAKLKPGFAENFWVPMLAWPASDHFVEHKLGVLHKAIRLPSKPVNDESKW